MNTESPTSSLSYNEINSSLNKVRNMKIFFGHQSVGKNILEGIKNISVSAEHKINIVESRIINEVDEAVFLHASVGKNKDPFSKMDDFKEIVENGVGGKVDLAFFKFCYIDFNKSTNIKLIFEKYQQTLHYLKENYPQTTVVHFTVPLVSSRLGKKDYIKKIIGKPITKWEENIKRNQFNAMLRTEYGSKEPIFDLAAVESTYPDGKRELFEKDGQVFNSLVPSYTDDGGHLNELGSKIVASKLLYFLATL